MLNFDDASVESGSAYLEPGINEVKTKEITSGVSSQKSTPYVEITVEDKAGKTANHKYYTSTTVNEGKQKSAWDITKNQLLQITAAVLGVDADTAKTKMPKAADTADLASKLSTLLVGKPFAIKLHGEQVIPTDPAKKPWIKAVFGTGTFATTIANKSILVYDATKHIKYKEAPPVTNGAVSTTTTSW